MAINVNTVYKTVLLVLNQQQRGYMTPDEFNKTATQVQLNIFENYLEELNQQYRVPQNDTEYSNRVENLEKDLQFFQKYINNASVAGAITGTNPFTIDTTVVTDLYRLGSVIYKGEELTQYAQRNEITQILLSPLTQPTTNFPIYLYEEGKLYIYPTSIIAPDDINISYLKKPTDVVWAYGVGTLGQYEYNAGLSTNFELNVSEQTNVISRILAYAGLIINDPMILQAATGQVQAEEQNSKQ